MFAYFKEELSECWGAICLYFSCGKPGFRVLLILSYRSFVLGVEDCFDFLLYECRIDVISAIICYHLTVDSMHLLEYSQHLQVVFIRVELKRSLVLWQKFKIGWWITNWKNFIDLHMFIPCWEILFNPSCNEVKSI